MNPIQSFPSEVTDLLDEESMEAALPFDETVIEQIRNDLGDLYIVPLRYLCTVSTKMLRFHTF